jgi:acetyl esterase/lipase
MLLALALALQPAAVVIDQPYCERILTAAGYRVFPVQAGPLADIQRAIREVRLNARRLGVDPDRIVLVGAYEANLAGVAEPWGDRKSRDPVERVSAAVRAVVSVAGRSDLRGGEGSPDALAEASPVMHIRRDAPPFLLLHGDMDESVPLVQSTHWQSALQAAGVRCDLIIVEHGGHDPERWASIPGVRDWERELVDWLLRALDLRLARR